MLPSEIYQHLNADRREFRLLRLLPGRGDATICCQVHTASLNDVPHFEALSYVWGDPELNAGTIRVGDISFQTTHNLGAALRDLRSEHDARVLWIDAICINQQDVGEKTEQLLLMGHIYQRASGVVVHLSGFDPAFAGFLARMAEQSKLHWSHEFDQFEKKTGCHFPLYTQMFALFRASWWHRVWTLQEAVLASKLDFYLDSSSLALSTLVKVVESFTKHYDNTNLQACCHAESPFDSLPMNIWVRMKNLENIQSLSRQVAKTTAHSPLSFSAVISHNRHREATNELDHVFGMLGLLPGFDGIVNYTRTASEIYQSSVLYDIQQTRGLDILSQVIVPDGVPAQDSAIEDLPSWVPNWKQEYYPHYLEDVMRRQEILHLYNACGSEPACVVHLANNLLGVQGVIVDYIVAMGEPMPSSHMTASRNRNLTPEDRIMLPPGVHPLDSYPFSAGRGNQTYSKALSDTCVADISVYYQGSRCIPARGSKIDPTEADFSPEWMKSVTSNRRHFLTARGYYGLAPRTAQLRDTVCVLFGGKVPYMIRDLAEPSASTRHVANSERT